MWNNKSIALGQSPKKYQPVKMGQRREKTEEEQREKEEENQESEL